jgi:signal transduction histidine kinase
MDAYETKLFIAILVAGALIVTMAFYFAFSAIRHQRRFVQLQRSYFLQELSLLENERRRIARDLHDELGPLLSVTKMLTSDLYVPREKDVHNLAKVNQHLEQIMHTLGEIFLNLTPAVLLKKGLDFALRDFIEDVEHASSIRIHYRYSVTTPIPSTVSIHLYRIIREVVHNCVKHSEAGEVAVDLQEEKGRLVICCYDNGKGFAIEERMQASTGYGLRSIRNRTEMLGGTIRYQSGPGNGTHYFFKFPLNGHQL